MGEGPREEYGMSMTDDYIISYCCTTDLGTTTRNTYANSYQPAAQIQMGPSKREKQTRGGGGEGGRERQKDRQTDRDRQRQADRDR